MSRTGVEERDMTYGDEEELEEEQDLRDRTTSSERIRKLPNRFYWKHGLIILKSSEESGRETHKNSR